MKKTFLFLITVIVSLSVLMIPAFAAELSNTLSNYVIQVDENTFVQVTVSEYNQAYFRGERSPLYNYLKGQNDTIAIYCYYSPETDKYIAVSEFNRQYFRNNSNVSIAIEKSQALPLETVKTFWEFKGFDENGDPILVPVIPDEEPTEPTAKLTITPDPILKNNFNLASVQANILGVENVDKYAIKYSVKDANDNKHYVTTKKASIKQTNPDLIQYIENETELEVLIYDTNGKLIAVENLKVDIN